MLWISADGFDEDDFSKENGKQFIDRIVCVHSKQKRLFFF